ncbi:hypothetical protein AvCA_16190 [Azotobacter vinelandii CA]|uniref:FAD-dependent urate hydroxylase HpyO/Asp monooxygenase CreE-like FAD/NAD(P)-binding domain-containing protein n=2 Tax=Azotobacter vinelandii TaxID=354 RepID=C1DRU6_AZOVD|nr:FAD/NAD(P)-binding protein [Azotobacter vinelandii]ACO77834.1 Conserved hypothetical protein [Azotobacter vinelandii DJ]AGK15267.1 hypothetical protein AvCA_16190 [Azotobacter vinelandii CA]AGK20007.1 hypothetical protein AvCA6_16190 [Azotobacter vinelandii CA6]SFX86418.1 Uncharacterized NAD(P)/FAD-binding protein YdhS [Azotobacter vinelandii]GLK62510.1 hydroxyacylglutathione hydrolase [Azotobacter vinelandii]
MKTLAIIGAGFSGVVTAIQFLRHASLGTKVVLIDRSAAMGPGLAYGTDSPDHLLNVPAGNMSALADDPDSFLRFCQERMEGATARSFATRRSYGEYLAALLDAAERDCPAGLSLQRVRGEVCCLRPQGNGAVVELAGGEVISADRVVLACGHFPPSEPPGLLSAAEAGLYLRDPWKGDLCGFVDKGKPVLLLGAGLTALDVAVDLLRRRPQGRVYLLSRRGLRPLAHRLRRSGSPSSLDVGLRLLGMQPTIRGYLREMRRQYRQLASVAGDDPGWRDLIAALRPHTPQLWGRLPEEERRRFLRHVQPFWEVHRHLAAPESHQRFQDGLANGSIEALKGRIGSVEVCSGALRVSVRLRGSRQVESIEVGGIVNCTGPNADLRRLDNALIAQLLAEGHVQPDAHGLGLSVDERLAVRDARGSAASWLSYVGPMLRANFWEATAVPELRQHAKSLAIRLAEDLRSVTARDSRD